MSRNLILSHLLPAAASSAFAGIVNYGILQHSFRGAGIGALAGLVYSATHDILKAKKSENSLFNHGAAILSSALLTYAISAAAAAAGLVAMPTLAGFSALIATAIIVNAVTRLIFKPSSPDVANSPRVKPRTPHQVPPQHSVKQIEPVNPAPQQDVAPVANPVQAIPALSQSATVPPLPPVVPKAAMPLEQPKLPPENPPATTPPPPPPPLPPAAVSPAPALVPTPPPTEKQIVDQFLDSADFKNCTNWLIDFSTIDASKWFHKSADKGRYITTGGGASIIFGAQTFVSLLNNHTNEQLVKDLQASTKTIADTLPKLIPMHNSCQDKTSIQAEIEKIKQNIKPSLKNLAALQKTYKSDANVRSEITNLMKVLRENQRDLLTKLSSK